MSEERLQEIKDSISLQYKVQEANDLNNFNIFTDEEQELVEEIERLNNIINEFDKWLENINIGELDDLFIGVKLSELKKAWNDIKGSDSNE